MDDTLLDKLEYDENAPDVKSIMAQIRSYVAGTRPATGLEHVAQPGTRRLEPAVYEALEQAGSELGSLHVSVYVAPARVPIIGGLLQRVRRAFHQLVVYYIDRLADAQTRINTRLVRALTGIVTHIDSEGQGEQVRDLEARMHEIESRMQTLESALNQPGPGENQ